MRQPPCSLDLAPCDVEFFGPMKDNLHRNLYENDVEVKFVSNGGSVTATQASSVLVFPVLRNE